MSNDKFTLKAESDLSPYVMVHWEKLGYCVHGEVSIFNTSLFIDHVAHLGPCDNPTHIVGIEMKKGATKSLRKQVHVLQSKHVVDEVWGVVMDKPRDQSITDWENTGLWAVAGLLVFDEGQLVERVKPLDRRPASKRRFRKNRLLLVPENRRIIAGYPSGHVNNIYHTHWSISAGVILDRVRTSEVPLSSKDILADTPYSLLPYRKKSAAVYQIFKHLSETKKQIKVAHVEGRSKFYTANEKYKPLEMDGDLVDTSFRDLFDIE